MDADEPLSVSRFTAGTIGPKGARTFYLQATADGGEMFTFKLEKQQVAALAQYLASLLEGLGPIEYAPETSDPELVEPFEELWVVGSIGVAWNELAQQVVVGVEEFDDDPDDPLPSASAHFTMSPAHAASFVRTAVELVEAGRPPCQYCGAPLNDEGGWCPCHN